MIRDSETIGDTGCEWPTYQLFVENFLVLKRNGLSLTDNDLTSSYAVIRHNIRTYRSDGVVEVVKGRRTAESTLQKIESCQDSSDYYEGWRYFIEKTDQEPGIDSTEATLHRQQELDVRESTAMREIKTMLPPDSR